MNCARARELLALNAGGDLLDSQTEDLHRHLRGCPECGRFQERLETNQSLLRSLRRDDVKPADLVEMRRELFPRLKEAQQSLNWTIRLERFLMLGFRRPRYAVAGAAMAAVLSAMLFSQAMRPVAADPAGAAPVFSAGDLLQRPEAYREWVLAGSSTGAQHAGGGHGANQSYLQNVYIHPRAYKEYTRTGKFPEGTVLVLEAARPAVKQGAGIEGLYGKDVAGVAVSVKDSRFEEGWGFFEFPASDGLLASTASPQPESAGCLACHRDRAADDHVFTQFYPVLRSASGVL